MENNFFEFCRGCRAKTINGIQMSKTSNLSVDLATMFSSCSTLVIKPDDNLPKFLCTTCLSTLLYAYEFQLQCINTDRELRFAFGLLYDIGSVPISVATPTKSPSPFQPKVDAEVQTDEDDHVQPKVDVEVQTNEDDHIQPKVDAEVQTNESDHIQPKKEAEAMDCETEFIQVHGNGEIKEEDIGINQTSKSLVENEEDENNSDEDFYVNDNKLDDNSDIEDNRPLKPLTAESGNRTPENERREESESICVIEEEKTGRTQTKTNSEDLDSDSEMDCPLITFTASNTIEDPLIEKPNKQSYSCKICEKSFRKAKQMVLHSKRHNEIDKPFKCDICKTYFIERRNLIQHRMKYHLDKFKDQNELRQITFHNESKLYTCNVCNREFFFERQLICHLNKHTEVKSFKCKICEKGMFIGSPNLFL